MSSNFNTRPNRDFGRHQPATANVQFNQLYFCQYCINPETGRIGWNLGTQHRFSVHIISAEHQANLPNNNV
jgi:hypothetical protein